MNRLKHTRVLLVLLAVAMLLGIAGCGKKGQDASKTLVLTVGEEEIYLDEVNFYALSMASYFGITDDSMLDKTYSSEYATYDEAFKAQLLTQIRQTKILYIEAKNEGITLTDDQTSEIETNTKTFMQNYSNETLKKHGITEALIKEMFTEQAYITNLEATVSASATITESEYSTTYNLLFKTVQVDENGDPVKDDAGNLVYVSDEEKQAQLALAEEALARIQAGENMEDLVTEYNIGDVSGEQHGTKDTYFGDYGDAAYSLQEGEVYDGVVETTYGYNIIKMVTLKDEDYSSMINSYKLYSAQQEAITNKETEWFNAFAIDMEKDMKGDTWKNFTFKNFVLDASETQSSSTESNLDLSTTEADSLSNGDATQETEEPLGIGK